MLESVLIYLRGETFLVPNIEDKLRGLAGSRWRRGADGERMRGQCVHNAKPCEAQETVLARFPVLNICGYGDASEAVLFDDDACFLTDAVFENGAEPGIRVAGNVDGGGGNEVIPAETLEEVRRTTV